jgi:hypothetical protein
MSTTKFKYLDEKLGLGATKSFFPFYDNEKDKDFKVRLDVLVDLIAGQVTSVGKSVFELSGITNSGNNYSSSYTLADYITEGIYIFQPNVDSSGNSTLNIPTTGLGSLPIQKFDGTSLVNVDDLKAVNTYLLINKTTYWLLAGGVSGGSGGVSTFSALTDSPYDNTELATVLNSKQDRLAGIVSGCVITVETFVGVGTNKRIRVTDGTWYIPTSEYTKATDTVSSEITLCVTGGDFKYYDIVADDSGAITIYEGTPSTAPAHYVINPLTEVLLGFITVGDAVIEEPSVISDSLEKKFEGIDLVTGSFTLDCESKDFPAFFIRLNGTAATLDFSNYWNVVEGTIYIAADSTTVLNLPTGSKTGGVPVTAKTFDGIGRYRVTFGYLYGEYYFNFDTLYLKLNGGTLTGALNYAPSVIPTSSATPAIGAAASNNITITSTTTITGFDTIAEGSIRRVKFAAITPLTHSANLDLPTSANITTAVGDEAVFRSNGGGSWKCISFLRKNGSSLFGVLPINNSQNTAVLFWENGIGEDLASYFYDRTNKILTLKGTLPTVRLMNADGTYSTFERSVTANTFKLKNQVLQAGGIGKSLRFNGVNQYGSASGTGAFTSSSASFTMSVWVKLISYDAFANPIFNVGNVSIQLESDGSTYANARVTSSLGGASYGSNLGLNTWHNIVLANGSGDYKVYIDGSLAATQPGTPTTTSGTIYIAEDPNNPTYAARIEVDQAVLWSVKLTAGEITTLYNSGAGTASLPQLGSIKRRYEFEEGVGSTVADTSGNAATMTLFNSPIWINIGKVPVAGSSVEATVLESSDGATNGERGVSKFGEFNATNIFQGKYLKFLVDIYYFFITDNSGNLLIDSSNTSNSATPTAKLTVGAPTALLAGFRFIAGVLNTAAINLGDFNHITSQRTFFKRKGATTANSLWVADSDVHFTQTDTKTVTNTVTATSIIGTLVSGQTLTFPADFWVAGKMEEIEVEGVLSNLITDSLLIDVTLGGTNISTSGANTLGSAYTNVRFKLTLKVKCETVGSSGTFRVTGEFRYTTALGVESVWSMTKVGTTTINTTTALALDVKATWGAASASNTITSYNSKGLILN